MKLRLFLFIAVISFFGDPNPRFYDGRVTQGAQGGIYYYAMTDVLTREKETAASRSEGLGAFAERALRARLEGL